MLLVGGVGKDLAEVRVSPRIAAVLLRSSRNPCSGSGMPWWVRPSAKTCKAVVLPAHGGLDHLMQAIKPHVGGQQQPPPHRRVVRLGHGDLDLEDRGTRRGRTQSATKRP